MVAIQPAKRLHFPVSLADGSHMTYFWLKKYKGMLGGTSKKAFFF
jgi:hypothetical protein